MRTGKKRKQREEKLKERGLLAKRQVDGAKKGIALQLRSINNQLETDYIKEHLKKRNALKLNKQDLLRKLNFLDSSLTRTKRFNSSKSNLMNIPKLA